MSEQDGQDRIKVMPTGAMRTRSADQERYDLITPIGLEAVARLYAIGAEKFGPMNCELGFPISELVNHALRHWRLYSAGDRSDSHLAKAAWGFLMAVHSEVMWPHLNTDLRREGCIPPNVSDEEAWAWKGLPKPSVDETPPNLEHEESALFGRFVVVDEIKNSPSTPKNFYFAAQSTRAEELRGYRNQLEWSACNVTSRWIDRGRPYHSSGLPSTINGGVVDANLIQDDWNDLLRSDAIVLFTDTFLKAQAYHAETAVQHGKQLVIVGPNGLIEEPGKVSWSPTWAAFLQSLDTKVKA